MPSGCWQAPGGWPGAVLAFQMMARRSVAAKRFGLQRLIGDGCSGLLWKEDGIVVGGPNGAEVDG